MAFSNTVNDMLKSKDISSYEVTERKGSKSDELPLNPNEDGECIKHWGFDIDDLFSLGTSFLKEKEGKAFNLSYKDKISLVALVQQATHGKYIPEKSSPIGYLDVIGKDRRRAWSALEEMSKKQAKNQFINLLDEICPLFKPFAHAHKFHLEEKEWRQKEEERKLFEAEMENSEFVEEIKLLEEKEKQKQTQQKNLIQEALNRQTFHQFKTYAEQQCPGDPEQQGILIRQLQEQHYQQYMLQVLNQNLSEPEDICQQQNIEPSTERNGNCADPLESSESSLDDTDMSPISAASMWTRKDIQDFKDAIRKEGGDGIIKVGHGETVTVRVPTHEDGTCLFWEFATDSFDIAFGVYFEWTKNPDSHVSVHISDSEDGNEEEEDDDDPTLCEIEKSISQPDRCPQSIIIPVYRRDCHDEVYAGSHNYPGQGVYLLKFDNSYSLWRSKMLYYRVYYTR